MLGHNLEIEVVYLDKIRVLKCEILEQFGPFGVASSQVFKTDGSALHLRNIVFTLDRHNKNRVIDLVQKS